jgi:hypothetical protein
MMGAIAAMGAAPAWTPQQVARSAAEAVIERHQRAGLRLAALEVSRRASERLDIGVDEAWNRLCDLPDNLLGLLDFPEGWTALVAIIAQEAGLPSPHFVPSVH